jgi:hypothetical protein
MWNLRSRIARAAAVGACLAALPFAAFSLDTDTGGLPSTFAACNLQGVDVVAHAGPLTGSQTWGPGVHQVKASVTVPLGATLTVAPCTRVEMARGTNLYVYGRLMVEGADGAPVDFVSTLSGKRWGAIWLKTGGTADLAYATLLGGGGSLAASQSDTMGSPLYVNGLGDSPLRVDHVTVEGATGVGVALVNAGFASGSTALTVHGSGAQAVYLGADGLGTLPDGTYTGNAVDAIALQTAYFSVQSNDRPILQDTHVRNLGVPYCVGLADGADLVVGRLGNPAPVLTIDAGVRLGFTRGRSGGGRLLVVGQAGTNSTLALGAIVALGTATQPVVFDSCAAAPVAGDWIGLRLEGADPRTRLDHVVISHAGADSSTSASCPSLKNNFDADAALQVAYSGGGAPAASFLTNSTITASASNAVFRGWQAANVDFLASNTLSGIAWCAQTNIPDASNNCPKTKCPRAP